MSKSTSTVYILSYWVTEMWGTRFKSERFIKSETYFDKQKAECALEQWKRESGEHRYGTIKESSIIY